MDHSVELLMREFVTHDVQRFVVSRPPGFDYEAGQGVELAIDEPDWRKEGRPFSPTSLRGDRVLEFTIKGYREHHGVTERLHSLRPGARLLLSEPFGTIHYRGAGVFIAGGAGVTPFIAIIRQLAESGSLEGHSLIFSNKTPGDIICEKEFRHYFGTKVEFVCTRESGSGCESARIDKSFLQERVDDFSQRFYVCGPPRFVDSISGALKELGASPDALVFEE